jgi:methionyl-tRNA synthetase
VRVFELADGVERSYGVDCSPLPLGSSACAAMMCELAPGQTSTVHNHVESEIFVFLEGVGRVRDDDGEVEVTAGQGVELERFSNHMVQNLSDSQPLRFVGLYWLDEQATSTVDESQPSRTLIFSTPVTPNGDLHLGHLSGPYLAADIARRALARRGGVALHVTGRDDHQTYVAIKAASTDRSRDAVADAYAAAIRETLDMASIPVDGFIEPTRQGAYAQFAAEMVRRLYDAGHILAKTAPAFVGEDGCCLHEAYVCGGCPHCGADCDGNACEACGRPNQCVDLRDPVDRRTGRSVRVVEIERLYFRFEHFAGQLASVIKQTKLPAKVYALAQAMIDDGLPDICVSHPSAWGLPIEIDGFTDHVLYVWFEMAAGYLFSAARALAPDEDLWTGAAIALSGETEIVHAYGFDNAYYHALLFPAIYLALDIGLVPPAVHLVNELLDLDGEKFSTSRGHVIWAKELLQELPADVVRFGLALARPQGCRTNFSLDAFVRDANAILAGTVNGWLGSLRNLCGLGEASSPEPGAWLADQQAYYARVERFVDTCERALSIDGFAPHEAARELAGFAADSARFVASQQRLEAVVLGDGFNYLRTARALGLLGLRAFATMAAPIMPDTARRIERGLSLAGQADEPLCFEPLCFVQSGSMLDWDAMPCFETCDSALADRAGDPARS